MPTLNHPRIRRSIDLKRAMCWSISYVTAALGLCSSRAQAANSAITASGSTTIPAWVTMMANLTNNDGSASNTWNRVGVTVRSVGPGPICNYSLSGTTVVGAAALPNGTNVRYYVVAKDATLNYNGVVGTQSAYGNTWNVYGYSYAGSRGQFGAAGAFPTFAYTGNNNAVTVNVNADNGGNGIGLSNFNNSFRVLQGSGLPGVTMKTKRGTVSTFDPAYTFTPGAAPHTGIVSFAGDIDATDPVAPMLGTEQYLNGDTVNTNNKDDAGNPVNENTVDANIVVSNLQVLGLDGAGEPIFGTGTVAFRDDQGTTLFSAALSNIMADPAGSFWSGTVSSPTFPDEANSQLLQEWDSEVNAGSDPFNIAFDPSFITATNNFSTAASMDSFVMLTTFVPEPGMLPALALGALSLYRRRRHDHGTAACSR